MRKIYFLLGMIIVLSNQSFSQFSIAAGGTNYTQNFDGLASTGTGIAWADGTTLQGWYARTDNTASITTYNTNTGSTTTAALNSFGIAGTNVVTERSLGFTTSNAYFGTAGSAKGYIGWRLKNNTGSLISSITVTWTGEQWRKEASPAQTLQLSYQTGTTVTDLVAGTWTSASSVFTSPIVSAATAAAIDGNAPANRTANISATITVSIPAGTEIMLRWEDLNDSGNDHILTIDDVTINATVSANPSIAISAGGIGASTVFQGSTGVVLQRYDLAVTSSAATINGLTTTTAGTYAASDLVNLKAIYSSDAVLDVSDITLSTKTTGLAAGTQVFPSFTSQNITSGTTGYVFVTADISATATAGNTINVGTTSFSDISFAGTVTKTGTDPVAAAGTKTFAVLVPSVAISNAAPVAGTINQNSTSNILYSVKLDVTVNNIVLNGITVTTGGTYQVSDLQANSFKFWINSANNLTGATQLGTSQAIVASGGTIGVSGLTNNISVGTTQYILVTADVAFNAAAGNTVRIESTPFTAISFASGTKTGTDPVTAGNDQTIAAVTPSIALTQTGPASSQIPSGTNNVFLYQFTAAVTSNTTVLNSLSFTTAGTYGVGDIAASSFKLWYNTVNSFGTATQLGTSQAVVASGGTLSFTGLSQQINTGSTGFFWLTANIDPAAVSGNTINIAATPFSAISFSAGTLTGTDPLAAGGVKTFALVPQVGEVVINQFNPGYSGTSDEYIELVNKTGKTFDLSLLKIGYQAASGGSGGAGGTLSGTLLPYSYWLLSTNATVTVGLTSGLARDGSVTAGFASPSGQLALQVVATGNIIDGLGYGTLTGGTFSETSAAPATASNAGLKRNEGDDTNNNSADFTTVAVGSIDLRNSSSRLTQTGAIIPAGTYTRLNVKGNSSASGAITASEKLEFLSGKFSIGNNDLTAAGTIVGASSTSYVVTDGTGSLIQNNVGATAVVYPVGPSTSLYHPATITNAGTADNFGVNVVSATPPCANSDFSVNATWNISEAVAGGSNCDLTFDFTGETHGLSFDPLTAQIVHCVGTGHDYHNGHISGNIATGSGFTNFSPFGISNDVVILPVSFTNVKATLAGTAVRVDWTNATETGVVRYEVERSLNGSVFSKLGTQAAGNDGGTHSYLFNDAAPVNGSNYYRIRAIQAAGRDLYSAIVKVDTKGGASILTVYPNPVGTDHQITLQLGGYNKGTYSVRLFNAGGQQVYQRSVILYGSASTETLQLPAALQPGVYNLEFSGNGQRVNKSVLIK